MTQLQVRPQYVPKYVPSGTHPRFSVVRPPVPLPTGTDHSKPTVWDRPGTVPNPGTDHPNNNHQENPMNQPIHPDDNTRRILKWLIPVDDQPHNVDTGRIIHIAATDDPGIIQAWTDTRGEPNTGRTVQAYGTGHPLPDHADILGTALAPLGLVWHLVELREGAGA